MKNNKKELLISGHQPIEKLDTSNPPNGQSIKNKHDSTIELVLCEGVEGKCIYLNNHRIVGPKPWGGATSQKNIKIKLRELESALKLKEGTLNHLKEDS